MKERFCFRRASFITILNFKIKNVANFKKMYNIAYAMKIQSIKYNLTQITPHIYAENQCVIDVCFDLGKFLSLDISEDNEKQVGMLASLSFLFS